jgi:hypothetical protein
MRHPSSIRTASTMLEAGVQGELRVIDRQGTQRLAPNTRHVDLRLRFCHNCQLVGESLHICHGAVDQHINIDELSSVRAQVNAQLV